MATLLLLLLSGAARATIDVRSTLGPEVIGVDEVASFSIEVKGGGFSHLKFQPSFQLENLEIAAGPFESESISFVNGTFSRSLKLSWELRPQGVGRARVYAVSVRLGDQTLDLPERALRVQQQPTRPPGDPEEQDPLERFFGGRYPLRQLLEPPSRQDGPRVFLRAEVTPERPFVGQEALYTVSLYSRDDVNAVNPRQLPNFKGFWVRDVPQPQNLPTEMVAMGGLRYGRVVLVKKALFPLRPGPHPIEPAAVDVMVRILERSFFGPALERPEEVALSTRPLSIDVQPLPPAPPGFRGAVGRMALRATLAPRQVRVGEAAALTLTLAGEGNLQGVAAPVLPALPGLKVLPPQQEGGDRLAGDAVRGERTWTYAVVPERAGSFQLAAPGISFFDPATRGYRLAAAPALALTVRPPVPPPAAPAGSPTGSPPGSRAAFSAYDRRRLLPWLVALLALPMGVALVVTLVRRQRPPGGGARQEAARRLEEQLREAEALGRPRQAAAHIEDAWRSFLAERWKIPEASPAPRWRELVAARGAHPEAARELGELADELQYLRQAPQLSAVGALESEALGRSRRLIRRL
ncbi:MAG TPA: BatD family protein [Thermoanaerobaculia bacterium]|nr:BatD family protein [Thermoanaerobaculia bacterium]